MSIYGIARRQNGHGSQREGCGRTRGAQIVKFQRQVCDGSVPGLDLDHLDVPERHLQEAGADRVEGLGSPVQRKS